MRVPLIIVDPRSSADATRGTVCDKLVEAIDFVPTFLDATGAPSANHRLESRSLMPLLTGDVSNDQWRNAVFSEIDHGFYAARETLGVDLSTARGYMLRTDQWKYVYFPGFPPQLFDLMNDPDEFLDLSRSEDFVSIRAELKDRLFERLLSRRNRVTMTDETVASVKRKEASSGIMIGKW